MCVGVCVVYNCLRQCKKKTKKQLYLFLGDKRDTYCFQKIYCKVRFHSKHLQHSPTKEMKVRQFSKLFAWDFKNSWTSAHLQMDALCSSVKAVGISKDVRELSWMSHGVMRFRFLVNFLLISAFFDILALLSISSGISGRWKFSCSDIPRTD